jgi:DNA-binding transcriptional regulator YiaG
MAFRGPKKGRFNKIDVSVVKFITEMRLQGFPVIREAIQIKRQEIARSLNISEDRFKGSVGWCKRMMRRNGLALR